MVRFSPRYFILFDAIVIKWDCSLFFPSPLPPPLPGILFVGITSLEKKNPRIFLPVCFHLAFSWFMMPAEVVSTMKPN